MLFPQHKAAGAKAEPSSLVYSAKGWPGGSAAVHAVLAAWIRKARQVGSLKKRRFSVSGAGCECACLFLSRHPGVPSCGEEAARRDIYFVVNLFTFIEKTSYFDFFFFFFGKAFLRDT